MVSKHYNIQTPKKMKQHYQHPVNSAPPSQTTRQINVISSVPNPDHNSLKDDRSLLPKNQLNYSKHNRAIDENNFVQDATCDRLNQHKELTIGDIGRFQYILQMDRELVRIKVF